MYVKNIQNIVVKLVFISYKLIKVLGNDLVKFINI